MRILFQRDCLFALEEYQTQVRLFLHPGNTTAVERMKRGAFPEAHEKVIARLHLLSLLTLPTLPQSHLRAGGAVGARRLLEIAVAVMEYRKTHGRLPDAAAQRLSAFSRAQSFRIRGNFVYLQAENEAKNKTKIF